METNTAIEQGIAMTSEQLLGHWQGHRALTRRMIEAFPEDKFFSYSVGGMRPFAELVMEMIGMAVPGVQGLATGKWATAEDGIFSRVAPPTKKEVLELWDDTTKQLNELWATIPAERFQVVDTAFGQWTAPMHFIAFYWVDNEIHHRGQAYVYLRSLGIAPPPFWER